MTEIILELVLYSFILSILFLDSKNIGNFGFSYPIVIGILIGIVTDRLKESLLIAIPLQLLSIGGTAVGIGISGNWSVGCGIVLLSTILAEKYELIPKSRGYELLYIFMTLSGIFLSIKLQKLEEALEHERVAWNRIIKESEETDSIIRNIKDGIWASIKKTLLSYFLVTIFTVPILWIIVRELYRIIPESWDHYLLNLSIIVIPVIGIGSILSLLWEWKRILIFCFISITIWLLSFWSI